MIIDNKITLRVCCEFEIDRLFHRNNIALTDDIFRTNIDMATYHKVSGLVSANVPLMNYMRCDMGV